MSIREDRRARKAPSHEGEGWLASQRWDGLRSGDPAYVLFLVVGITVLGFLIPMLALVLEH